MTKEERQQKLENMDSDLLFEVLSLLMHIPMRIRRAEDCEIIDQYSYELNKRTHKK